MPVTQTASGGVPGSTILKALQVKLYRSIKVKDAAGVPQEEPTSVRIVARPNPDLSLYRAEKCLAIRFPEPVPDTNAGAGRYGQLVTRDLEVYLYTQNLSDQAGDDEMLALAHLDYEELVIDVLVDERPLDIQLDKGERVGVKVRFIPGGDQISRDTKRDVGMATSVLRFEVQYQLPYRVRIDA